ncbi:ATP synthase CF0 subunit I (chloroplast) [Actinidia eriantha]|uniref:ATP synthase subunit b, chloroplastic n=8 Tax=Mesangiospermae TaxID=1437183 RepID=A0A7M1VIZ7_ACTAR|nr:ATP synthase CF0 subunit I [Actinidia eriantha]YP_009378830.1 ATP synthase CF0 subunit I [Actinidia kolomikta]YP_009673196.1 ATP synthase CF0 subunit I [Actinidia callosa var. henryi]YP_009739679.1 ATP synthase CF0 subunit I [Actinidia lanceolata]QMX76921.1 ATP synthase CF0 subunit I [Actinidia callosa var. strigillosa]QOS03547.1 ATP synthase CF0 subunit I [Actinidia arguta]QUI76903.1 ATP synthase CF0 subunit I [Actinidia indochinensis]QUI77073.1 ATP synthase CF0 subunit I [Actinidia valv
MKNVTDSFVSLGYWPSAGSFGFNTDILATNPINLSVVLGVLIFFGKGVCASCLNEWKDNLLSLSDLLDNRKQRILNTIRNSEELRGGAIEQLEKARARLRKVEMEADQYRVNGYSEIERQKLNLINSTSKDLEQLENSKNETIYFEQQRAINQVRQRVFQQALQRALRTLNSCLNNELHLRTISANIGMFEAMKEITD